MKIYFDENLKLVKAIDTSLFYQGSSQTGQILVYTKTDDYVISAMFEREDGVMLGAFTASSEDSDDDNYSYMYSVLYDDNIFGCKGTLKASIYFYNDNTLITTGYVCGYVKSSVYNQEVLSDDAITFINTYVNSFNQALESALSKYAKVGNVTVTLGASGSNPSVSITGSGTNGTFDFAFTIPKGDTGEQGPQGIQGPQGDTGPLATYGEATTTSAGLMSANSFNLLQTIKDLVGDTTGDGDTIVNKLREVLDVFNNFPEGDNLVTLLATKQNKNVGVANAGKVLSVDSEGNIQALTLATGVAGAKGNSETTYRTGNVNITADNVGAYDKTSSQGIFLNEELTKSANLFSGADTNIGVTKSKIISLELNETYTFSIEGVGQTEYQLIFRNSADTDTLDTIDYADSKTFVNTYGTAVRFMVWYAGNYLDFTSKNVMLNNGSVALGYRAYHRGAIVHQRDLDALDARVKIMENKTFLEVTPFTITIDSSSVLSGNINSITPKLNLSFSYPLYNLVITGGFSQSSIMNTQMLSKQVSVGDSDLVSLVSQSSISVQATDIFGRTASISVPIDFTN